MRTVFTPQGCMAPFGEIEVDVSILIGATDMPLERLVSLGRGAVILLGRDASGPLAVLANGARVAEARVELMGERVNVALLAAPQGS